MMFASAATAELSRLQAEIERLRQTILDLQRYGKRREVEVIEECAQVVESYDKNWPKFMAEIAAAIRALREKV